MPTISKEDAFRLANEEAERIKKLSPQKAFEAVQAIVSEYKKAQYEALPEEVSLFPLLKPAKPKETMLGAERHYLGFAPTFNTLPEPTDIFQEPQQPTRLPFMAKEVGLKEAIPMIPELRAMPETKSFRETAEYEKRVNIAKEARLIREEYDPGDRMEAIVQGVFPAPARYKPVGFEEAFPVHRLAGRLTRILALGKAASLAHVATGTATGVHEAVPWLIGKSATTPVISQIMNHDIPAAIATKLAYSEWFPAVVGNAVERGLVWSADAFIEKLGRTLSPKEAVKAAAIAAPFGMARGAIHVLPFQGVSSPSEAGRIGLTKLFGQAVMEKAPPKALEFGADVLPVILAGGIGGAESLVRNYWEQGDKFKKTPLKEAMIAAAWSGFIEAVGHKHLVEEWKRFNLDKYLWDKADAAALSAIEHPQIDHTLGIPTYFRRTHEVGMSKEALKVLYYRNFKLNMSPAGQARMVYEHIMKDTIPHQFSSLQPEQISQIQVEFTNRVLGGEDAVSAFGDIVSQFYHAIKNVKMPVSEIEIPGMVLPSKYRTDFAELLRQQIIQSESVPLHPAREGKELQKEVIDKLKAKYPEYNMEEAIDKAMAKLPPKYHTAFAEALQRRLKLSEAVPLHPAEIGRDAERVAAEVSEIQEEIVNRLSPLLPMKESASMPKKPQGKTSFQEYMEKARGISQTPEEFQAPEEKPVEPSDHERLRKHAFALQDRLEKMGFDKDFINEVIKEGKSYAHGQPNSMSEDELKGAVRRMLGYLENTATTRRLGRKEQKRAMRDAAIRAKIFHKLPEKPDKDLYHQVKEQFKDYEPETAHVFDWIRGVRHVFRKDKLLHDYGFKPLHDDAMIMENFIVENIRPARQKAKDIGVGIDDRRIVTNYRNLKWLKMVNPGEYGPVPLPILNEKQKAWDGYLTQEYTRLAGIFNPQNLLPFDVYSPLIFDDTADDPEMKILGTFFPEGVPKNVEAFFMKKRENKNIKDKIHDDSLVLLERYIRSGAKTHFLKEDVRRIRQDLLSDPHVNESMKKLLQSYTERVLGYPSALDEFVGQTFKMALGFMGERTNKYSAQDFNNLAHTLINLTYMSTMGLRPMPVLKNLTQSLNTACELGPSWVMSGIVDFMFKGWDEADRAGVLMEYAPELYREFEEENNFDRLRDLMLIGFQSADKINRSIAYYAATNKFNAFSRIFKDPQKLKRWLLSHHLDETKRDEVMDAVNKGDMNKARHLFAEEIVAKTQYLYNKYDSPLITRSSLGKMYFQFASWPENYIELMVDWGRNKNYAAFLRAAVATIGLALIAKQTDKKWLKKFIYGIMPGAALPMTEWKLHRYAIPPSMGPVENLLYVVGDIQAFAKMEEDPEKYMKTLTKDLKRLLNNTAYWAPGGMLAKDIYKWSSIPIEQTGEPMYQPTRSSLPRTGGIGGVRPSLPRR